MRPLLLSSSDVAAGASRAAHRLHSALRLAGIESRMLVRVKRSDDPTVDGPRGSLGRWWGRTRPAISEAVGRLPGASGGYRSLNVLGSRWSASVDGSGADVVNVHWVGAETASIADLGRITHPVVWTLHDMWPFTGANHYEDDGAHAGWRSGYRAAADGRMDRWTWQRKSRAWRPAHVICPSHWLAECARESALMSRWPIHVIPNPLDTERYAPADAREARARLGLPRDRALILFGAIRPSRDRRKGLDLLLQALRLVSAELAPLEPMGLVLGQDRPERPPEVGMELRWLGHLDDEATVASLYAAADVVVVPSRQENLPQSATEAAACGRPVVAFHSTGLPDVVTHRVTGYLAKPGDPADLAAGIAWVLADEARRAGLGDRAREHALRHWSPEVVLPRYLEVYRCAAAAPR